MNEIFLVQPTSAHDCGKTLVYFGKMTWNLWLTKNGFANSTIALPLKIFMKSSTPDWDIVWALDIFLSKRDTLEPASIDLMMIILHVRVIILWLLKTFIFYSNLFSIHKKH